jgi:translation elongation factor EF-G
MSVLQELLDELLKTETPSVELLAKVDSAILNTKTVLDKLTEVREKHDKQINKKVKTFAQVVNKDGDWADMKAVKENFEYNSTEVQEGVFEVTATYRAVDFLGHLFPVVTTNAELEKLPVGMICIDRRSHIDKFTFTMGPNVYLTIPQVCKMYDPSDKVTNRKFSLYNPLVSGKQKVSPHSYYINKRLGDKLKMKEDVNRVFRHPDNRFNYNVFKQPKYGSIELDYSEIPMSEAEDLHSYSLWMLITAINHSSQL